MSELQDRLAALSPDKKALFERKLREKQAQDREDTTAFALSVPQQGIWFFENLRPGNPAYIVPAGLRLRGPVHRKVLGEALDEVVRRHEALRTTFHGEASPYQVVHDHMDVDLPEVDLSGLDLDEDALSERLLAEIGDPFDLSTGPLLRARLLVLGPHEHVLAVATHHLVSDGWSMGVLLSELSALYQAFERGEPSPLPLPAAQYRDFVRHQYDGAPEAGLAHWRRHLEGAPTDSELPTDRPRPRLQSLEGGSVPFELPEQVVEAIAASAKEHGVTPYMVLLSVLAVLLGRYSGQDDVVIGVPTANRPRREFESVIGFFVNTVPIRVRLEQDPAFTEVLESVRTACMGLYAHQDVHFEHIVEEVRPDPDLSKHPLFQVSLSYQGDPSSGLAIEGVDVERIPLRSRGARFDLELQLFTDGGGLNGWLEYDSALFDESTAARMASGFRTLVDSALAEPESAVGELAVLDRDERRRILHERNDTGAQWPGLPWIHECFEEQAARNPGARALCFEGAALTYGELNTRANQLARHLRGLGVGRDVLVGVSMERSVELVTALLAVLKAGGAYVPVDPDYPAERVRYMLEDAAAPVLLTQRSVAEGLPETDGHLICLDELQDELGQNPGDDLGLRVEGTDAAYVIYTSGSTGRPKGVVNVHSAIRNRLLWAQDTYGLDHTDAVLQKTPFSFDVSVWEFFWPLMVGARLVLARPGGHRDSLYLAGTIEEEGVTTVHFVPSMLHTFLRETGERRCPGLRRVLCSGEVLTARLRDTFFDAYDCELHNLYGPTEAAIDVTAWQCRRGAKEDPVPIGRPVANTSVYVLDEHMRPVPDGAVGELHVGGANLARGYLGRPDLTADKFVPDPFSDEPGARLYKTGDLARHRVDGAVEFLGRSDHQVKLRGLRVEPGEVESVLTRHPRVSEAVVVVHEYARDDLRLVAYVGVGDGAPVSSGELLGFARQSLPPHMVPAAVVFLEKLPLTPNGKVDRAGLPAPGTQRPDLEAAFLEPEGGLQKEFARMWRELLGVDRIGAQDSFFDLGGNSLLMARFRERLEQQLGHRVSMVDLFRFPTVGSLAGHVEGGTPGDEEGKDTAGERAELRRRRQGRRRAAGSRERKG